MKTEEEKDEQLIRWLEGELSGQELSVFEASEEFKDYQKIIDHTQDLTYPQMDEDAVFSNIQNKISSSSSTRKKSAKVIPLKKWIFAVASIAVLAFAVLALLPGSVKVASDVGQFVSHTLPEGSEIDLNGNSQIDYKSNFSDNRVLQLNGEAFFKVKKGKSFEVETKEGKVTVLGTSFNVFARDDIFVVSCKTGKVKVDAKNRSYILEKGERVKIENNEPVAKESINTSKIGNWIDGESYFSNATLEEVMLSLSSIYDIDLELPSQYQKQRFTGTFVHSDLKKALKMVFSPMHIPYTVDDEGKIDIGE